MQIRFCKTIIIFKQIKMLKWRKKTCFLYINVRVFA
nr:MAG TPA: hypothetical protein [Caudoviricetes sp.]